MRPIKSILMLILLLALTPVPPVLGQTLPGDQAPFSDNCPQYMYWDSTWKECRERCDVENDFYWDNEVYRCKSVFEDDATDAQQEVIESIHNQTKSLKERVTKNGEDAWSVVKSTFKLAVGRIDSIPGAIWNWAKEALRGESFEIKEGSPQGGVRG